MLTVTIFATIVADMLPVSNNTPLIGWHFAFYTEWVTGFQGMKRITKNKLSVPKTKQSTNPDVIFLNAFIRVGAQYRLAMTLGCMDCQVGKWTQLCCAGLTKRFMPSHWSTQCRSN